MSIERAEGDEGRQVVLVFTDGDDTASRMGSRRRHRTRAHEGVMVYAIGMRERVLQRPAGACALARIAG